MSIYDICISYRDPKKYDDTYYKVKDGYFKNIGNECLYFVILDEDSMVCHNVADILKIIIGRCT